MRAPRPWLLLALVLGAAALTVAAPVVYARTIEARENEDRYRPLIAAAELRHGIPRGLLHRLIFEESRFRTDIINGETVSSAGAAGIAQFMPATAADFGIDPLVPEQAIDAAARHLARDYRSFGDWSLAVAAYNAGPGNVRKYGGVPPFDETQRYVAAIMADVRVA